MMEQNSCVEPHWPPGVIVAPLSSTVGDRTMAIVSSLPQLLVALISLAPGFFFPPATGNPTFVSKLADSCQHRGIFSCTFMWSPARPLRPVLENRKRGAGTSLAAVNVELLLILVENRVPESGNTWPFSLKSSLLSHTFCFSVTRLRDRSIATKMAGISFLVSTSDNGSHPGKGGNNVHVL